MTKEEFTAQKSLANTLDRCAARADMVDASPATGKQCWYLAGLILKAGEDGSEYVLNTSFVLTKREASHLIDIYKS
ncbi:hypothetical protein [uncultured Cohaesibacter sp.]|uniref:hypothetical protein n=1 Tax=uncultured Cohaesibacter sp. TaxID=1002546 RepID=UPI0029C86EC1|nr:hypothetical protein [uncultured Cohaesibacter sp.]